MVAVVRTRRESGDGQKKTILLEFYKGDEMLAWWSNVFAMLGVALIATAFFRPDWQAGCVTGSIFILFGAILKGLSIPVNGERK